jgi:hypothetical protein
MALRLKSTHIVLSVLLILTWSAPLKSQTVSQVNGDCVIRAPCAGSEIVVTTTNRVAGAIHALTWGGQPFIDSADHGRQLQSASNFDCGADFFAETFNPTEAGSRSDGAGANSTSRLLHFVHGDDWLQSTNQMAFWLRPGQRSHGHAARNKTAISNHLLTKRVKIGIPGFDNVIRYRVTFSTPLGEPHRLAQFEVLTGYMPIEFRAFYALSIEQGALSKLTDGPGEQEQPVLLATKDGKFAMGAILTSAPRGLGWSGPGYGRFAFDAQNVTKWNVVCRLRDRKAVPSGDYPFEVLVAVGDLETVKSTLMAIAKSDEGD